MNWFTWSNMGKILLVVAIGYLLIMNFFRADEPIDNSAYIREFNQLQRKVESVERDIMLIDEAFDVMYTELEKDYETIDSATIAELRDIINGLLSE